MRGREGNTGLPNRYSQSSNRQSRSEANCKLILASTTDDGSLIGVFSDPDNPFRIHKNFHAVYVLKHDELHVSSFSQSWCRFGAKITERAVILPNIVQNLWTPSHVNCRKITIALKTLGTERCRLLSRFALTLQDSQDRSYCVPVPCRRWCAVQFVDLAEIADCLHVTTVHSKHKLAFRRDHSHQPLSI